MVVHRIAPDSDGDGWPIAWQHTIAGQPIMRPGRTSDDSGHEGISDSPYFAGGGVPAPDHDALADHAVTVQWWARFGNSHTALQWSRSSTRSRDAGKRDPVALPAGCSRTIRTTSVCSTRSPSARLGQAAGAGIGRGVAIHESFGSVVAPDRSTSRWSAPRSASPRGLRGRLRRRDQPGRADRTE